MGDRVPAAAAATRPVTSARWSIRVSVVAVLASLVSDSCQPEIVVLSAAPPDTVSVRAFRSSGSPSVR